MLVKTPGGKFVLARSQQADPARLDDRHQEGHDPAHRPVRSRAPSRRPAKFFDGIFKITQTRTTTDLTLTEALARCPKRSRAAAAAKKKPKTRKLWGDGSGSFRTRGQYSAATVRGTRWLVQDSCAGTLTRVTKGVVTVRDHVKRKTLIVRAGKKYLAKPRKR